jgi:hypothetical protein
MQYYGGKSEMLVVILYTITKKMTDLIKLGKFKGITSFIVQFAQASAYTAISIRLPRRQIVDGHSGLVSGGNKIDGVRPQTLINTHLQNIKKCHFSKPSGEMKVRAIQTYIQQHTHKEQTSLHGSHLP